MKERRAAKEHLAGLSRRTVVATLAAGSLALLAGATPAGSLPTDGAVPPHAASAPASAPAPGGSMHAAHAGGHGGAPESVVTLSPAVPGKRATGVVKYVIDATLDPDARLVSGRESLTWTNTTTAATSSLCFHLYLNAFRNTHSTFLVESKGRHRRWDIREEKDPWGAIDVTSVRSGGIALELTGEGTLRYLALPSAVPPGANVTIDIEFSSRMPRVFARTGYADTDEGRFFMVAQWFPKIGVLTDSGWMCDDFHLTTEFFADFGSYDVRLTVPEGYVVGATGMPVEQAVPIAGGKSLLHHYTATDVHDFAWTAWEGYAVKTARGPNDVEIVLLYDPAHDSSAAAHLEATRRSLELMGEWLIPYPYPRITLVDPPPEAGGAGGMEYPTFITVWTEPWVPDGVHAILGVTYHEFAHQYFYGLLASNEPREAFLDEGIASYYTARIANAIWGEDRSVIDVLGVHLGSFPAQHANYGSGEVLLDPVAIHAWEFRRVGDYGRATYSRMSLAMATLEAITGRETLDAGMKLYAERYAFTHPTLENLEATLSEAAGTDLSWYFDATLRRTGEIDYRMGAIRSKPKREPMGIFRGDGGVRSDAAAGLPAGFVLHDEDAEMEPALYEVEVDIERHGSIVMPVELRLYFEDGSVIDAVWTRGDQLASPSAWYRLPLESESPLVKAELDPDHKLLLDRRWVDNGKMIEAPAVRAAARWSTKHLVWLQTAMQLVGF